MQEALRMHRAKAAQQADRQTVHIVWRQALSGRAEDLGEVLAVLELHDGVGRAVGLEVAQHRHDVRMAEARERARLVEEALAAPGEVFAIARPARHHALALAHCELDREILLDGDELGELGVEGAVGNAKAAMTDHGVDAVITQPRAEREGLNVVLGHERAKPGALDARSRAPTQAARSYCAPAVTVAAKRLKP